MTYKPCRWYKGVKHGSKLDNFIKERSTNPDIYCDTLDDVQTMVVNYIQCVKLDDIEEREPWSPSREEAVKKWATPDNLRRLKYHQEEETGKRCISGSAFHDIPMLSREFLLHSSIQEKFKISDGIHRINRARELRKTEDGCSMDCILASVEEHVDTDKNDSKNIETKLP
jgi:hypothetical protein